MKKFEPVPFLDLKGEIEEIGSEAEVAIKEVVSTGTFILGPAVTEFERNAAAYLGVKHAIGLNSGTDALVMGLRAMGIGEGDEVITTAFSFFATAESIEIVGARAVFVDIDPVTFNLDVDQVEAAINDNTAAILPVHLYGHAVDMDPIMKLAKAHDLRVLEDTAQAWGCEYKGKKAGVIGDVGAFSFYPTKNLGCFGDGGLLTTNDDEIAHVTKMLRDHGSQRKYHHETLGYNSRLDAVQAAVLNVKLPRIDAWNNGRREAAKRYDELLSGIDGVTVPVAANYTRHVYHQYTIRIDGGRRDHVHQFLGKHGIGNTVYYPSPMHKAPYYLNLGRELPELPLADQACNEVLSLPIGPRLQKSDQENVAAALQAALAA